MERIEALRQNPPPSAHHHHDPTPGGAMSRSARPPGGILSPPILDELQAELSPSFTRSLVLWKKSRETLLGFGGELDKAVSMPGWTNVWTLPIQNRVDMLATGVNTAIGVRVLGRSLDDVVDASNRIAAVLRRIPGAADVVADPLRGKGAVDVRLDRERASTLGVDAAEVAGEVELAVGGKVAGSVEHGRDRYPIRVRYARDFREDEGSVARILVRSRADSGLVPVAAVADVRVVEGPATVKAENGLLRNYVRLNLRGRDAEDFIEEARKAIAAEVPLPPGAFLEWAGQFEHQARARKTLLLVVPAVLALILLVLHATFQDAADALLILLTAPGAIAGGVIFQRLTGEPFSVTVWVGYIAGFGMAAATGVVMLVYLRDAVEKAGGLGGLTPEGLRQAVLDGAVQRLRPKLLTEGTTILGLAPVLWASGVGSEVIRPMAAPVIGGLLVADEVIDLLIPVLFYRIRLARLRRMEGDRPHPPRAVA
ncbi:MAG: efflux RND transporter permease subunit [Isosphaeraceae bacterium]